MKGHLEKRGPNTYRAKVYLGPDPKGRRQYVTRTFHCGRRQAEDFLHEFMVEVGAGSFDVMTGTVADLAHRWLTVAGPSLSPTTLERYRWTVDRIIVPKLGTVKLRALRPSHLDALYAELLASGGKGGRRLSPASVDKVHRLMHRLLAQAARWGWITSNPAAAATPPRIPKPQLQVPDAEGVLALIGAVEQHDPDMALLLRVAAVTGARRGEICALRWSDIDLGASTLVIARTVVGRHENDLVERQTKTGNRRRISIDPGTVEALEGHQERCEQRAQAVGSDLPDDAFVFSLDPRGLRPRRPDGVSLALRRMRTRFGIDSGTLLSLRHFAATQLLTAGVDVRTVAGRLGHANPATTLSRYAEWLQAADQAAAIKIGSIVTSKPAADADSPQGRRGRPRQPQVKQRG
jgi:integrase